MTPRQPALTRTAQGALRRLAAMPEARAAAIAKVDREETELVVAALNGGANWRQIAEALGKIKTNVWEYYQGKGRIRKTDAEYSIAEG